MALILSNLAPDVVFSIFAFCDISSVISASETCRYLHDLAFDKSVWLGLLDNLRRRSILDRTCNLENLSVAEMIGIVQRLITGPQTWSPGELDRDPVAEISRTITLHPQADPQNFGSAAVELLPSGCYVLFENQDTLECWSVAHDRLVWRYTSCLEHSVVVGFTAEETDIESAVVMICVCADVPSGRMHFIEIVSVNLRTGTHIPLLAARAPDSQAMYPFFQPVICGALAAVKFHSEYLIMNWRAKSNVIVHGHDSHSQFALIPQHLIVMTPSINGESQIHLISSDIIKTYLLPVIALDDPAEFPSFSVEEIPKVHTFHATNTEQSFQNMDIHASPIHEAEYRLWIWGLNHAANKDALVSYQLSIPINGEPQWRLRCHGMLEGTQLVSYSGHVLHYEVSRGGWTIIPPDPLTANPRLQLFRELDFVHLTTYSGAMACPTVQSTIVIQYYR
ncbi:hypothetical protein MSAN_01537200 [Mycena sanguinolenta]|uniref:F-box domain-containing protein n=1 Tax=Mycena sanguinolenta TaxID=230812 RepID=A0A8H6Y787_9AGAR|nr:hypothetical protein MSAN_01537200 [Mycena sanguinolenta]